MTSTSETKTITYYNKRLSDFLNRHDRIFMLTGALIVFSTFVFRDELRDNLKDIVSAIDTAKIIFAGRVDNMFIATQLNDIGTAVDHLHAELVKQPNSFSMLFDDSHSSNLYDPYRPDVFKWFVVPRAISDPFNEDLYIRTTKNYLHSLDSSLDNVARLIETIGSDQTDSSKLSKLRGDLVALDHINPDNRRGDKPSQPHNEPNVDQGKLGASGPNLVDNSLQYKNLDKLVNGTRSVALQIHAFSADVLKRAEQVQSDKEWTLRICDWLSIALFAIGWGLGVVAKIFGIKTVSE